MMRIWPGRSVTSMRPSGRKASDQGLRKPLATVSTASCPDSVRVCARLGVTATLAAVNSVAHRSGILLRLLAWAEPLRSEQQLIKCRDVASRGDTDPPEAMR